MQTRRHPAITGAAVLFLFAGGIGVAFGAFGFLFIASTGQLPGFAGIRFWGGGLFESLGGIPGIMVSLIPWAILGGFEIISGVWLWSSLRRGGWMALALTPAATVFMIGYGAPFGYVVVPLRVLLVILGWRNLGQVSPRPAQVAL
ncbi:MAG: hypothetical protein ACE5EW_00815 [Thermoplasmata archaeon]